MKRLGVGNESGRRSGTNSNGDGQYLIYWVCLAFFQPLWDSFGVGNWQHFICNNYLLKQ
ncbi:MAG: hypothetical protein ACRCUY_07150 [Thermoguttaceae bacterium]